MKLNKSLMAAFVATSALWSLTGCDNDPDYPPVEIPHATIEANTTIAEVKEAYWQDDRNYAVSIGEREDGSHIIVAGRVTNNCASGNVYKSLIIQDETAALAISLNESDMSQYYKVGQEVVIDLTGMSIGKYNGLQQIGEPEVYQDGYEVTFLDSDKFKEHAQVNGLPDMSLVDTLTTTMDEIQAMTTGQEIARMQSRLIRLDNVSFQGGGTLTFCSPSESTNRTLVDENGNRMTLRMSNYATFSQKLMPKGTGSLVCILSYYGTNWQLLIRDLSDCIGFEGIDDNPGGDVPAVPEATVTVEQVLAKYWKDDLNYCEQIGQTDDGKDMIVTVRVFSNDQSGNVYKQLFAQDATGALMFSINKSRLYQEYPVGQAVNVNLTGLYIGRRQGMLQVGALGDYNGTPQPDRLDESEWATHASITGSPNPADIKTFDATIPNFNSAARKWSAAYVKLAGVHFAKGGTGTFVEGGQATSVDLLDASGNTVIVRTSAYADWGSQKLPAGTGNVTAIVTYYNQTPQLILNSSADCTGFSDTPGGDTPPTPSTNDLLNETFAASQGAFTIENVKLPSGMAAVWTHSTQFGMVATAYDKTTQTNYESESWLISPVVDLSKAAGSPVLTFDHALNFFADIATAVKEVSVWAREEGGAWQQLSGVTMPAQLSWTFVGSGNVSLSAFAGKKIQIGFKYTSTAAKAGTWEVKNVIIK